MFLNYPRDTKQIALPEIISALQQSHTRGHKTETCNVGTTRTAVSPPQDIADTDDG
jgi:hypothetical protein